MLKRCYLENVGAHNLLTLKRTGLRLVGALDTLAYTTKNSRYFTP